MECCRCWDQAFSNQTHSDVAALHWNGTRRGWSNHWPGGVWGAVSKVFQRKANQCTCQEHCESDCFHGPWAFARSNSHAPWWKWHLWNQLPMHYRAQSCSKRALLLDVHHDVQHFDFGSGGWVCKRANDAYTSFDHVYTQYAIMSSAVTILERKVAQMETDLRRLRERHRTLWRDWEWCRTLQKISNGGWPIWEVTPLSMASHLCLCSANRFTGWNGQTWLQQEQWGCNVIWMLFEPKIKA